MVLWFKGGGPIYQLLKMKKYLTLFWVESSTRLRSPKPIQNSILLIFSFIEAINFNRVQSTAQGVVPTTPLFQSSSTLHCCLPSQRVCVCALACARIEQEERQRWVARMVKHITLTLSLSRKHADMHTHTHAIAHSRWFCYYLTLAKLLYWKKLICCVCVWETERVCLMEYDKTPRHITLISQQLLPNVHLVVLCSRHIMWL